MHPCLLCIDEEECKSCTFIYISDLNVKFMLCTLVTDIIIFQTYYEIFKRIPQANVPTVCISLIAIVILVIFKEFVNPRVRKRFKAPIPIELFIVSTLTPLSTCQSSLFSKLSHRHSSIWFCRWDCDNLLNKSVQHWWFADIRLYMFQEYMSRACFKEDRSDLSHNFGRSWPRYLQSNDLASVERNRDSFQFFDFWNDV